MPYPIALIALHSALTLLKMTARSEAGLLPGAMRRNCSQRGTHGYFVDSVPRHERVYRQFTSELDVIVDYCFKRVHGEKPSD